VRALVWGFVHEVFEGCGVKVGFESGLSHSYMGWGALGRVHPAISGTLGQALVSAGESEAYFCGLNCAIWTQGL
jgi:hypothetical protein